MSDSIIDQATTVVYNHLNGETRFALSDADCIVKALSDAGLLRPEIDDAMIERARAVLSDEGFLPQNVLGEEHYPGYYNAVVQSALEAALGGEQND